MTSCAVVKKYDENGQQTKGFTKLLCAMQNYESALEEFEIHVEKSWKEKLENLPEPTAWQKFKGWTPLDALTGTSVEATALYQLEAMVRRKNYRANIDHWKHLERTAFNGNIDVASWYVRYSHLRNIIRCSVEFHLDAPMCKFVNVWNNRFSCFR